MDRLPSSHIIDITHSIRLNNLIEAGFVIRQTIHRMRKGYTMLVKVGAVKHMLVYLHNEALYILPDNGLVSMVFDQVDTRHLYTIPAGSETDAIIAFESGALSRLTPAGTGFVKRINKPIQTSGHMAIAECIYIDGHGNCYFNMMADDFESFIAGRAFTIRIQHYTGHAFNRIHKHINEVQPGDAIFRFSSGLYLKLQINQGSAKQLFRIKDDTKIIIELT